MNKNLPIVTVVKVKVSVVQNFQGRTKQAVLNFTQLPPFNNIRTVNILTGGNKAGTLGKPFGNGGEYPEVFLLRFLIFKPILMKLNLAWFYLDYF